VTVCPPCLGRIERFPVDLVDVASRDLLAAKAGFVWTVDNFTKLVSSHGQTRQVRRTTHHAQPPCRDRTPATPGSTALLTPGVSLCRSCSARASSISAE